MANIILLLEVSSVSLKAAFATNIFLAAISWTMIIATTEWREHKMMHTQSMTVAKSSLKVQIPLYYYTSPEKQSFLNDGATGV